MMSNIYLFSIQTVYEVEAKTEEDAYERLNDDEMNMDPIDRDVLLVGTFEEEDKEE